MEVFKSHGCFLLRHSVSPFTALYTYIYLLNVYIWIRNLFYLCQERLVFISLGESETEKREERREKEDSGFACKEGHGTKSSLTTAPKCCLIFFLLCFGSLHPTLVPFDNAPIKRKYANCIPSLHYTLFCCWWWGVVFFIFYTRVWIWYYRI